MGQPGLDPQTALQLIQALLYWIAYILGGAVLLGLSAYIVFLGLQIFSPQPVSKARLAKVPQPVGRAAVAEENLGLVAAVTPILAEAESPSGEAVRVPALPDDAQVLIELVPSLRKADSVGTRGFLGFLRSRRAVVPPKRRSNVRVNAQLEKLA